MKKQNEEEQEDLIRSVFRETSLDTPSADFTNRVMSKIGQLPACGQTTAYTPLISRQAWGVVILLIICVGLFAIFGMKDVAPGWLSQFRIQLHLDFSMPASLRNLSLPVAFLYGLLAVTLYIYYQVMRQLGYMGRQRQNI